MKNIRPLLFLMCLVFGGQLFAQEVELQNIKPINTDRLDFTPVPFGDGLMYTSSKTNRFLYCPSDNPGDYTDLMFSKKDANGEFTEPVALQGEVNRKYNDGTPTFNALGNKMIFARNNLDGRNSQEIIDLKLYSADLVGDEWVNVTSLPFNSDDWSTCHPALSNDGSMLIFSSNRPGSRNMDLWSSKLVNGAWAEPVNMGPAVNSDSSDIFPYLDAQNNLFFSSKRPGGMGGLDLYAAKANAGGNWELLGSLGTPFNGSTDDVNFVPMNGGTEGYLATADRSGGAGMDDIYHWKYAPEMIDATIVVIDRESKERLPNASVTINLDDYGNMLDKIYAGGPIAGKPMLLTTDANGVVKVRVPKNASMSIVTNKTDYEQDTRKVSGEELSKVKEYVIPLTRSHFYTRLNIKVIEDPTGNPIPLADIKLLDKTTGKVITLTSDGNGKATQENIDCEHEYEIVASKNPYYDDKVILKDFKLDCKDGQVDVTLRLKSPLIVYLEPIYYDFDRYYIRKPDATHTLDSLVTLMKQYPTLHVLLGAHCDARGSNAYNERLADNRVRSAKKYLVERGIAAERLETNYFGEREPANNCVDNVKCSEPEHQVNRRVDVDPTRHQEPGIEFRKKK